MDKREFENMMGSTPEPEETDEEREAREARIGTPEMTIGDMLHPDTFDSHFEEMEKVKEVVLRHYGLADAPKDERAEHEEAMYRLLSEEQRKQLWRAQKAYDKRNFSRWDENDKYRSLVTFAATNPPEVLRKHIWRLQRGLDEPMFGLRERKSSDYPNRIQGYKATLHIYLCSECAEALREESEANGESPDEYIGKNLTWRIRGKELRQLYEHRSGTTGFYLFHYENMWVESEIPGSIFGGDRFPYTEPRECHRCGVDDIELWRERYGGE